MARAIALAALVGAPAVVPCVARAANDHSSLLVSLQLANTRQHNFQGTLLYNCNLFFSNGQSPGGRQQFATADGTPAGSVDFAHNRGEAFVKRTGWQVEPLPPVRARPTLFADVGVSLQGRNVFLTSRVTFGRSFSAAARRRRLAVVRGAKRLDGPLLDQRGKNAPNTFSFIARGPLKMLPAMSRALERTRCKGPRNSASRRFKPGYDLGTLTVGLRPDHATGVAGNVQFKPLVTARGPDQDQPVAVQAGAGVSQDSKHNLLAPITTGLPVPLACESGANCGPSGGTLGLGGSFDLVFAGRRTSVANITFATTGTPPDSLRRSITGTLDGAPVVIATGPAFASDFSLTDDFTQRAGAALGAEVTGSIQMQPLFGRTGP